MLLFPKKVKYRRWQVGRQNLANTRMDTRGTEIQFGTYGLIATSRARIDSRQIEAARKTITRTIGKLGRYWIRLFPDRPYTQKGAGTPMGKGKGALQGYCFEVLPGRVLFEVEHANEKVAKEALRKASTKLALTAVIVDNKTLR
jgi:large subunit ribosomal protein L16